MLEFWYVITNLSYFIKINAKNLFFFFFLHYPGKVQELDIASIMDGRVSWFCRVEGLVQGLVEKDLQVAAWKMRDKKWKLYSGEADSKEIWIFKARSEMRGKTPPPQKGEQTSWAETSQSGYQCASK